MSMCKIVSKQNIFVDHYSWIWRGGANYKEKTMSNRSNRIYSEFYCCAVLILIECRSAGVSCCCDYYILFRSVTQTNLFSTFWVSTFVHVPLRHFRESDLTLKKDLPISPIKVDAHWSFVLHCCSESWRKHHTSF